MINLSLFKIKNITQNKQEKSSCKILQKIKLIKSLKFQQKMLPYTFLPHTADIKFQAQGKTLEQAFTNSALALTNIITKDNIKPKIKRTIIIRGKDKENLLYNFLEEFLYLLDIGGFLLSEIKSVRIQSKIKSRKPLRYNLELKAEIFGDDQENYETETHIKAITYNDMFIKQQKINNKTIFITQVVVDV